MVKKGWYIEADTKKEAGIIAKKEAKKKKWEGGGKIVISSINPTRHKGLYFVSARHRKINKKSKKKKPTYRVITKGKKKTLTRKK